MGNFDKYKGLFAQQGGFDIPSSFTVGVAFRPTSQWLIALDFERIYYDDAPSVNNPSALHLQLRAAAFGGQAQRDNCLGGDNGAGFGWQNVDVWKIGVQYMLNDRWTLRAGYNHTRQPDHAAGRHVQHHRPGRRAEPVVGRARPTGSTGTPRSPARSCSRRTTR